MASQSSLTRTEARVDGGEPEDVALRLVIGVVLPDARRPAVLGRTFDAHTEPAEGSAPFAVLSYDFWQRRFGGRPDVLGTAITLRGGVVSVIGVDALELLRRDGRRAARRLGAAGHAGSGDAGPAMAAR